MFKTFTAAMLGATGVIAASHSRGVPPTTQNCNSYPMAGLSTNIAAQNVAWGLVVDIEFGGCRCADEDEMEFGPTVENFADNNWSCKCLNSDLYLSQPIATYSCIDAANLAIAPFQTNDAAVCGVGAQSTRPHTRLNDGNGKKCGVNQAC